MQIKGAIFDMDGTLLDSMWIWLTLGSDYLKSKGKTPKDDLLDKLSTMNMIESAEFFKNDYEVDEDVNDIVDGINNILVNYYQNVCPLKDGVISYLDYLKSKNIPMVIATSTDRFLVEIALKRLGIEGYFKKIFTSTELNTNKKTSKIYDECAKFLNLQHKEIVVFEDVAFAVKTAKDAGFNVVAMYDDFSKNDEENIRKITDKYIKSFNELIIA